MEMMDKEEGKLLFVYNANAGLGNALLDSVHKMVSPQTYTCSLCDLTYGLFAENREWKKFRASSGIRMEFLHRDEFENQYGFVNVYDYPIVFSTVANKVYVFITTKELNSFRSTKELILLIKDKKTNWD